MLLETSFGGSILFLIPSRPDSIIAARAKYGLHDGSGFLNSILAPFSVARGILIRGDLFLIDQAIFVGASNPDTSLFYELIIGFVIAAKPLACFNNPPIKYKASCDNPPSLSPLVMFFPSLFNDILVCIPLPAKPNSGFGMNVAKRPCSLAMALVVSLNVIILSAASSASEYLKSISCCDGPFS